MRSRSLRCSNWVRNCKTWSLLHGQANTDSPSTASKMGQEKRKNGRSSASNPWPLLIQMAISLSRYMRERVETMATNKLSVKIVARYPSTVKPIISSTSAGLITPLAAWPSMRINIMVITTVISTNSVAPKLRESSLRMDESNNIGKKGKPRL